MALLRVGAAIVACLVAGCYSPDVRDCVVTCAAEGDCAGGQVCGDDGYCAAPGVAGTCGEIIDGATPDDDAAIDAAASDAAPLDAPAIDAPPVDAGDPTIRVRVQGTGSIRDDAHDILCYNDCTYSFEAGTELTLAAEETTKGWTYDRWNLGPCSNGPQICVLTLEVDTQVRARFVE